MINLSDLQSDERIWCENDNSIMYVDDLRRELKMFPINLYGRYFTTTNEVLKFDAEMMVEDFIRSWEESGDGYEDMTERCMDDIDSKDIREIQEILDKISNSTESFITYKIDEEINIYE